MELILRAENYNILLTVGLQNMIILNVGHAL
jgi:hypothetical protein